jgi:endo-1,4-beta-xylanase
LSLDGPRQQGEITSMTDTESMPPVDTEKLLRGLADLHGFYVGTAVHTGAFSGGDESYRQVLKREYNILVAENLMKFSEIHPDPDRYDWTHADALVSFAEQNGMKVRGHTLVWHQQLPDWVTHGTWTRRQAEAILESHIRRVVGRYRGRIAAWDVVNEAVADEGGYRTESIWHQLLGPDFIALAFQWAHDADPEAVLYYNDYEAEDLGIKSDAVYDLMGDLKHAGVPVHGVGWQMHLSEGWRVTDAHYQNAERLRDLGLELSMTEMDVRLELPASGARLASQATSYREAFQLGLSTCRAVLTWGFTDKYSWIPRFRPGFGAALPLDADYRPKPAWRAIQDTLEAAVLPVPRPASG